MAAPPPAIVRIKRKRDEPPLAEFVLASKRPSLARLTLDDDDGGCGASVPASTSGAAPPNGGAADQKCNGIDAAQRQRDDAAAVFRDRSALIDTSQAWCQRARRHSLYATCSTCTRGFTSMK